MKKTLTINISGIVFHIDEDAFDKLQVYLKSLNEKFSGNAEGREIIADIELRIAEIFTEKTNADKKSISIQDVDMVIETMGNPEDFDTGEEEDFQHETRYGYRKNRRLYRDPDNTVISGVCGGLAAYFNVDPTVIRIIFIVLFFFPTGLSLLTYLILWIAVPVARTTAQKLEMRGEKVTVSNIERTIKDEFKNVKDNYNEFRNSKNYQNTKDGLSRFLNVIGIILKAFVKIILIFIGLIFIFVGAVILIALVGGLFAGGIAHFNYLGFEYMPISPFLNTFTDPSLIWIFTLSLFMVIFIPIMALVYGGVKLIFKFRANDKLIGVTALGIWLISLGTLLVVSLNEVGNYKTSSKVSDNFEIKSPVNNTIYLKATAEKYDLYEYEDEIFNINNMFLAEDDEGNYQLYGKPELNIVEASGNEIELIIKKKARGSSKHDARENADKIIYHWQQDDSLLLFDRYFKLPVEERWRNQEYDLVLKLPVGKTVFIDRSMIDIIYDIENVTNTYDRKMVDKFWEMKPNGLARKYVP